MPAATVMTTTFATPPRLRRRVVEGSGAAETSAARSVDRGAGALGAAFAVTRALRAPVRVALRREIRAKTYPPPPHDPGCSRPTSCARGASRVLHRAVGAWGRSRCRSADRLRAGGLDRGYARRARMSHSGHGVP